jgi:PAS domain S-box-containing protein
VNTILLVDDSEDSRTLVALYLRRAGFVVKEAGTGGDGLDLASADHPDLVILDVRLPDIDGFEVCRRLKTSAPTAAIPVLLLSAAYRGSEERARGLKSGADAYLTHPVEPSELVTTAKSLLRLRATEAAVRALFERTAEPMLITDAGGAVLEANASAQSLLQARSDGTIPARIVRPSGATVDLRQASGDADETRPGKLLFVDGSPRRARYAAKLTLPSGHSVVALTGLAAAGNRGGTRDAKKFARLAATLAGSVAVIKSIAERRHAEDVRWQLASIVESSDDAIIGNTLDGIVFTWNAGAERMYGYSADEIKGRSVSMLSPPGEPDDVPEILGKVQRGERLVQYETARVTKDGRRLDVSLTASPLTDEHGTVWGVSTITRDISERKRADERLRRSEAESRALSVRIQSVREEERAHIAREIHDELGQVLTGLKMELAAFGKAVKPRHKRLARRIEPMLRTVDHTIDLVRRIASELRPGVLDVLGVADAIEWQARDFQGRSGIRCRVTSRLGERSLDQDVSTAIFRIFQESLTNVARHAKATKVTVRLAETRGRVILKVSDDGRGITEGERSSMRSLGLVGMRERAALLGGEVSVTGVPGGGTTVVVSIPRQPRAGRRPE